MNELADFKIGDRLVRPALNQVVSDGREIHVEPRSMDVLVALAERGDALYPKKELIGAVWDGAFVSDEVLTHAIWELRKALGDEASNPRFIQTIPKRGYRLIATVDWNRGSRVARAASEAAATKASSRWLLWILGGALTLFIALWLVSTWQPSEPPLLPEGIHRLEVVSQEATKLGSQVANRLTGSRDLAVLERVSCSPAGTERTFCLEVSKIATNGKREVQAVLKDLHLDTQIYSTPAIPLDSGGEVDQEIKALVAAYFDLIAFPYYGDRDLAPWYDLSEDDVRAVRDFHLAAGYIYNHEVGGSDPLLSAIDHDPDFLAPMIWLVPSLIEDGETERAEDFLRRLDGLYHDATSFGKAMIQFAQAHADNDLAAQRQNLRLALQSGQGNRIVLLNEALVLRAMGNLDEASGIFRGLAAGPWEFGGLYATAAECSIEARKPQEAEDLLEVALELEEGEAKVPIRPEALALLELLAIYDGDGEARLRWGQRLAERIPQLPNEVYDYDRSPYAEILAEMADSEDRNEIAKKLRELSD